MQEEKTAQVRVKRRNIVEGHAGGTIYYTTPSMARTLMGMGVVDLIGGNVPGPAEQPTVGPKEVKSSEEANSGHSTGSAQSNQSGEETQSSASEADPASQQTSSFTLNEEELAALKEMEAKLAYDKKQGAEEEALEKQNREAAAKEAREKSAQAARAEAAKRAKDKPVSGLSRLTTRITGRNGPK